MGALAVKGMRLPGHCILTPVTKMASLPFHLLYGRRKTKLLYVRVVDTGTLQCGGGGAGTLLTVSPERCPMSLRLFKRSPSVVSRRTGQVRRLPFRVLSVGVNYPIPGIIHGKRNSTLVGSPGQVCSVMCGATETVGGPIAVGVHGKFSSAYVGTPRVTGITRRTNTTTVTMRKEAERRCCSKGTS